MTSEDRKERLIRIAVVESDPLRFVGLQALFESARRFDLRCVSSSEIARTLDTDVVLITERSGINSSALIEHLKDLRVDVRIILIGSATDDDTIVSAIADGAKGYINEGASARDIAHAIEVVNQGLIWAPRRVFARVVKRLTDAARHQRRPDAITDRERQVLEMLVAGRSNKEIALPLGIEERTVKAHVAKLMRKVGVQNRIALSIHAITHSLVAPQ